MEQKNPTPAFGGSSLLAAFAVICLITFSLLTVTTVQAEKRLSDSALSSVSAYYEADREAERIFAQLRNGHLPEQVTQAGNRYTYICPISHSQYLFVELERSDSWQVLIWQVKSLPTTEYNDHLPVWNGE